MARSESGHDRKEQPRDYVPPVTLDECDTRIAECIDDVLSIETQLGDPPRPDLSETEYLEWRKRARYALMAKKQELVKLRLWRKQYFRNIETKNRASKG